MQETTPQADIYKAPLRSAANAMAADVLTILRSQRGDGSHMFWPDLLTALRQRGHAVYGKKALRVEHYDAGICWFGVSVEFIDAMNMLHSAGAVTRWASERPEIDALRHIEPLPLPFATEETFKEGATDAWVVSGLKLAGRLAS
jgi:hypothetical protein